MNSHRSPRDGRLLSGALAFIFSASLAHAQSDEAPRGTLDVDRNLVRTGVHSQLEWNIEYPTGITEIVDIVPPNRIVPKKDVTMKVRVLGVSFQQSSTKLLPVDVYWSKNNSSWKKFFYGYEYDVDESEVLVRENISEGDVIDFGGRGWLSRWLTFHHTRKSTNNLVVLKNGDTPPSYAPAFSQGDITSFIRPYLDSGGKVNIGDRDLILLWEVYSNRPGSTYFDMQDIMIMVTFE
ncbi:MAG: hypothetical protein AAGI48_16380 [Verrucomicrobiota bacterium]